MKLLIIFMLLKTVLSDISIKAKYDNKDHVEFEYSGTEVQIVNNEDINLFTSDFPKALEKEFGKRPDDYFLKSPTPWGDLYKTYHWEQVKKMIAVKSGKVMGIKKRPVVLLSRDFENNSKDTIKINTGILKTVQHTLTTAWSKNKEIGVSLEIPCVINIVVTNVQEFALFSYTTTWGVNEEKYKNETIGASNIETELKPGQAVTAVLSVNVTALQLEVVHKASLRGNVAVNYEYAWRGHHFWAPTIGEVLRTGDIENEVTIIEAVKFRYYADAALKVFDKITGEVFLDKVL